jgi:hypothetical protein
VKLGRLVCIAYLSRMLFFIRFVAKTLREISDLQQVCFEIKLYLTREPKKEEVVKNGEHYTKRKYTIYTPSVRLLWYWILGC